VTFGVDFVLALSWDLGLETYSATNKHQGVCHTVAFAIYIKKYILRQKKNYEIQKKFTMQKYNLQKSPLKETKILQDIITL